MVKRVLLVGHDRGGVNLLVPLLSRWRGRSCKIEARFISTPMIEYEVAGMMTGDSVVSASAIRVPAEERLIGRSAWTYSPEHLTAVLDSEPWDLVLTGTSALSTMEKTVWKLCKTRGIPTAAICDMWTEYERRVSDAHGVIAPDLFLVFDGRMQEELRAALGPSIPTKIVGSPHFAMLMNTRRDDTTLRTNLRFISEPIAELFPQAGVHEFQVAETLLGAMADLAIKPPLILRPHPQDDSEGWRRFSYQYRAQNVRLDDEPSWACHGTTKMALGLSSMMLIEFAMAGIPVASFQPTGSDKSYFCLQEAEFGIQILQDGDDLKSWLRTPQPPHVDPSFIAQHANAIDDITAAIVDGHLFA